MRYSQSSVELEYKWQADTPGVLRRFVQALYQSEARVSAPQKWRLTDHYLDTDSWELSRRKIAFRIRRMNGSYELTIKTRSRLHNAVARRQEKTYTLQYIHSKQGALQYIYQSPIWQNITNQSPVIRFSIYNQRISYIIRYRTSIWEASLDNYLIKAAGKTQRRKEIELELKKGTEKEFHKFAKQMIQLAHLQPVKKSKVASAEALLKNKN